MLRRLRDSMISENFEQVPNCCEPIPKFFPMLLTPSSAHLLRSPLNHPVLHRIAVTLFSVKHLAHEELRHAASLRHVRRGSSAQVVRGEPREPEVPWFRQRVGQPRHSRVCVSLDVYRDGITPYAKRCRPRSRRSAKRIADQACWGPKGSPSAAKSLVSVFLRG